MVAAVVEEEKVTPPGSSTYHLLCHTSDMHSHTSLSFDISLALPELIHTTFTKVQFQLVAHHFLLSQCAPVGIELL